MVETQIRRPFLAATATEELGAFFVDIAPILSAMVSRGYDQQFGQATLVMPHPPAFWTAAADDVFITVFMHGDQPTTIGSPLVDTDPPTCRFGGRLAGNDLDLYPATVVVRCFDLLYQAAKYFPDADHDFAGLTDQEIVRAVLAIVPSVPLFIEDPDPIGGSGIVVSEDELIWPSMESALDVILEVDALSGYRTFVDANGVIRRAALISDPAEDGFEDHTLLEGVDLFDAHKSFDFLPPVPDIVAQDGSLTELVTFVSGDVERLSAVTPRSDIFEPGQTIRVTAAHLGGTDRNWLLQSVTTTIDEQGAFTQQLELVDHFDVGGGGVVDPPTDFACWPDEPIIILRGGLGFFGLTADDTWLYTETADPSMPMARWFGDSLEAVASVNDTTPTVHISVVRSTNFGCAVTITEGGGDWPVLEDGNQYASPISMYGTSNHLFYAAATSPADPLGNLGVYRCGYDAVFTKIWDAINSGWAIAFAVGGADDDVLWVGTRNNTLLSIFMHTPGAGSGTVVYSVAAFGGAIGVYAASADGSYCLAVSGTGGVLTTLKVTAGGATTTNMHTDVSMVSGLFQVGAAWVAAVTGTGLYHSPDGVTWTQTYAGGVNRVTAGLGTTCWALLLTGNDVLRSTDGGLTWSEVPYATPRYHNDDIGADPPAVPALFDAIVSKES